MNVFKSGNDVRACITFLEKAFVISQNMPNKQIMSSENTIFSVRKILTQKLFMIYSLLNPVEGWRDEFSFWLSKDRTHAV